LVPDAGYALAQRDPQQTLDLLLAGPGPGYTWSINGKLYDPPDNGLNLTSGQRVWMRFIHNDHHLDGGMATFVSYTG
jgi:multicopper oxidase